MAKFKVSVYEEVSGILTVEAKTVKQAERKAVRYMEENGLDGRDDNLEITHRDSSLV